MDLGKTYNIYLDFLYKGVVMDLLEASELLDGLFF